ncbi:MAG: BMP family ABC transporter substrate-binding protein [Actinobacteria bacterium]|nr:BMP family ABC transporter substrate-binding protein [Actinomycetota bacterium]MBV8598232.1 BMP family ABC transporter substrate-binding protein [Actinomycetota bacterium]
MRKPLLAAAALALVAVVTAGSVATAAPKATFTAALVSDIGKFNDKGFNQSQLAGLNEAKAKLGVKTISIQSNSSSDYLPNLTSMVRQGANIVSAAGYLLAPTLSQVAAQFPKVDFTITDDSVHGFDFQKAKEIKNIEGLVYASNQAGCLVGYLAGEMTKAKGGKQVIGAVGGIEIPAVDDYIVGYNYCAKLADPGIKVLVGYSQDFVAQDKCKTVAQNQIGQGSQVEFQVAGGCGLGALNAAADAGIWGIGVDVDQYAVAKNVLTSALKRVDTGIFDAIKQASGGHFKGGSDLLFDLANGGIGVGKISPKVPAADVAAMNALKAKLIAGTVKVPVAKGSDLLGLLPGATVGPTH